MKLIQKVLFIGLGASIATALILLTSTLPSDTANKTENPPYAKQMPTADPYVQKVKMPKLPKGLHFAGEPVPEDDFQITERIDRELLSNCFRHSSTLYNLKKSGRYFPVIEPILKKYGVPDDFKYLAVAESDLYVDISSPAKAKGMWQFLASTAEAYGLEVNNEVDERCHVEKATEAACKFLLKAKENFGTWTLAAASYNMGGGRTRQRTREQGVKSYYDLYLNKETTRYIPRILAVKTVMANPERYGFSVDAEDLYSPMVYRTIAVNTAVASWIDFAKKYGVTYRELKIYNPWIRSSKLTNRSRKTYEVRLPKQ